MTELAMKFDTQPRYDSSVIAEQPPTVITENEMMLGSAAALTGAKIRRNYLAMVRAALSSGGKSDKPDRPRYHPARHAFIEDALMARMMDRL